jgi:adenylate kinase family enzyme
MGDTMEKVQINMIEKLKKSKKICLFGCPGSGKSTLSKELSKILGLKVYHLDNIYWKPNWISISREEFNNKLKNLLREDSYIIEGNYNRTLDLRLEECDFAIYLDFNRLTCLFSVIKRYFQYKNKTRDDITAGCNEALDKEFIKYVWFFNKNHKKNYYHKLKNIDKDYIILKNRREVRNFLKKITE